MKEEKITAVLLAMLIGLFAFLVWYNRYKLSGG